MSTPPKVEDRRVRRTKQSIRQAFLELMKEKTFEAITVNDIAERADINRGTFYLHYTDKFDLLNQLEDEVIENFTVMQKKIDVKLVNNNPQHFSDVFVVNMIKMVQKDVLFFEVVFLSNQSTKFEEKYKQVLRDNFKKFVFKTETVDGIPEHYFFAFTINAQIGIIKEWILTGMNETPEELTAMMLKISSLGPLTLIQNEIKNSLI